MRNERTGGGFGWSTSGSVAGPKVRTRKPIPVPESPYLLAQRLGAKRAAAIERGERMEYERCGSDE